MIVQFPFSCHELSFLFPLPFHCAMMILKETLFSLFKILFASSAHHGACIVRRFLHSRSKELCLCEHDIIRRRDAWTAHFCWQSDAPKRLWSCFRLKSLNISIMVLGDHAKRISRSLSRLCCGYAGFKNKVESSVKSVLSFMMALQFLYRSLLLNCFS